MRISISVVLVLLFSVAHINGEETLILSGFYTGKNLYVQNPMLPDNKSFSTEEVYVNKNLVLSNPITSAFIIDLSHLSLNETVEVKIVHKSRYSPRFINAYVIRSLELRHSESFAAVKDVFRWTKADKQTLRWTTYGEKGGGIFEIQKAEKELWVTVGKIPAKELNDESVYKLRIDHQTGDNTYRLKLIDRDGYVSYSDLILYRLR